MNFTSRQILFRLLSLAVLALFAVGFAVNSLAADSITLRQEPNQVVISTGEQPIATYVFADKEISRPYFAHVFAPGKIQVTRNHPPIPDVDRVDHGTFHPGIWLAFGDLSGQDDWRLKAPVRHVRFLEVHTEASSGGFTVQNDYGKADDPTDVVCRETCRYTISIEPGGYLLICDSMFVSPMPFSFGDQEEMGLGVRMATKLTVRSGGQMIDASGRVNEKQIWGKSSEWCDYRGMIDGRQVGVMVIADPLNFRPMRLHVRDYGLLTANPFGQKAFGDAEVSKVEVAADTPFRLRFAVFVHATDGKGLDCQAIYTDVINRLKTMPRPDVSS